MEEAHISIIGRIKGLTTLNGSIVSYISILVLVLSLSNIKILITLFLNIDFFRRQNKCRKILSRIMCKRYETT